MVRVLLSALSLFQCSGLLSQLPVSQLFLLKVQSVQDTPWILQSISYLSGFNEGSYNNQPYFVTESILLASLKRNDASSTDIYRFDFDNRTLENLTQSLDHEYSPRLNPGDGSLLTYVHVPQNDSTVQNLAEQNLAGSGNRKFIFNKFAKIGYYRHYKDQSFICFLVDDPPKLGICNQSKNLKKIFSSSIGRCFEILRDGQIIYVDKSEPAPWKLKKYDPSTETSTTLQLLPFGSEDFALDSRGQIYCTQGSKILLRTSGLWTTLIDLRSYGIQNMQRIAIHQNSIAVVNVP